MRLCPGQVRVGGVDLSNHLILAAGVLGTTGASLQRMLREGAGGVVSKSIGPISISGHKGPCVQVYDHYVLNAMGLPNPSQAFQNEMAPLSGKPVIVSIFGGNPEEFATVASWFTDSAAAFELNVSCPHAKGYGAQIGTDPAMVEACTRAVKETADLPVWVKLTPNVTDITTIGRAAEEGGADAIVAVNTVKAMRINTELKRPVLGYGTGGLSGPAIFPVALRCVWELYDAVSVPIIGCGGVSNADEVIEMMMAGAAAVEIGTAVVNGPEVFRRIADDLYGEDGESPADIVGCAHA